MNEARNWRGRFAHLENARDAGELMKLLLLCAQGATWELFLSKGSCGDRPCDFRVIFPELMRASFLLQLFQSRMEPETSSRGASKSGLPWADFELQLDLEIA